MYKFKQLVKESVQNIEKVKEYFNKYKNIPIIINKDDDLDYLINFLKKNNLIIDAEFLKKNMIADFIRKDLIYIRISLNINLKRPHYDGRGTNITFLEQNFIYERLFTINDIKNGTLENIVTNGISKPIVPTYKPRTLIRENINNIEEIEEYFNTYENVPIIINKDDDLNYIYDFLIKNNLISNLSMLKQNILNDFQEYNYIYIRIRFNIDLNRLHYDGRGTDLDFLDKTYKYEKLFTINDIKNGTIKNIITKGISKPFTPSYQPRILIRESIDDNISKIVIITKNEEESKILQELLFKYDFEWRSCAKVIKSFSDDDYPIYFIVNFKMNYKYITFVINDLHSIQRYIHEDNKTYQTFFSINDFLNIEKILKEKKIIEFPNYKPRKLKYD